MPIYEYTCDSCKKEFEELVRNAESSVNCPVCGSESCSKKFSVFGFSAGNGFVSSAGHGNCTGCSHSPGKCSGCK